MLQYTESFFINIKLNMKSLTQWSAFYFTNKEIHISIQNAKIPITLNKNEY